jgi:ribonuclease R
MGLAEQEMGDFHAACKALMKTGRVVLGTRNALTLPPPSGRVVGTFRANPRGFGFVVPDEPNTHGDLFIPPGATGGAVTGDTVSARVLKRGKRRGEMIYDGRVVEVLKRGRSHFVGELQRQFGRWFVLPDGNALHVPIVISDAGAKGARPGDQVVVEITEYPADSYEARGVIVKVLGPRGAPGVDTLSIIEQHQLPDEFPEEVLEAARQSVRDYDPRRALRSRLDLRDRTIITIDPADARDFDDAISVDRRDDGSWELGVHIADVACFVTPRSPLDEEARSRANSVYLPDHVLPMLPEVLSNGLCSLQERQPRLTLSAFIEYDRNARVTGTRFARTVIRSTRRLAYEQATAILDGKSGRVSPRVVELLRNMDTLARLIRRRRIQNGMIVLELPEVEVVLDDDHRVVDVRPEDRSFSHTIIEMFMVEANEAVARFLHEAGVPALRRVHDEPSPASVEALRRFLRVLGHNLPENPRREDLQGLLDATAGKPGAFPVHFSILRSMQRAEYAPLPIGHYALASTCYTHFTSPIRRYPDLTIHRLIHRMLDRDAEHVDENGAEGDGTLASPDGVPSFEELERLGRHCSTNERRAESAERELKLVLILRLLEQHVGDELEGTVTGVANVGVFVQLDRYLVDGLLSFEGLPDDWWEVDSRGGSVVGQRLGKRITIGDRLRVALSRVDTASRQVALTLAQELPAGSRNAASRGGKGRADGQPPAKKPSGPARGATPRGRGSDAPPRGSGRGGAKRPARRR